MSEQTNKHAVMDAGGRQDQQGSQLPWAFVAVAVPTLLAANDPPSVTFYNQILSVFGWGLWMMVLRGRHGLASVKPAAWGSPLLALSMVLWITAAAALSSSVLHHLPLGLGLMAAGMALSAWVVQDTAWRSAQRLGTVPMLDVVAEALAMTGVIGLALGFLQVFLPGWTDGLVIAQPSAPGRAVGNLRQPNHLSTLLIWSVCGAVWLGRRRLWTHSVAALMVVAGVGGVVWTASRTGMLGMGLLTVWALRDKHLPRPLRVVLLLAPLWYALWWLGMAWWAQLGSGHTFAAGARLNDGSDISSSRFKIWSDTIELIRANPWTGVGWGEFNLAWTFTELPQRPVAFFDHTHNVLLHWAVELGLPLALLMTLLTAFGLLVLWMPWRAIRCVDDREPEGLRLGVVAMTGTVAAMAALHSLLEYPLWYAYFLLPAAMVWALGLAARGGLPLMPEGRAVAPQPATGQPQPWSWASAAPGLIVVVGAIWCAIDYQFAANIYAPRPGAGALSSRIAFGQDRLWFGYQADYAQATGPEEDEPSLPPAAFGRTLHNLVDSRLMIAYARSLAEHGEVDKARYIVARLNEFKSRMGKEFVAPCATAPASGPERPFQCDPPKGRYTWRDVLPY
jgi:O-antigen ligase